MEANCKTDGQAIRASSALRIRGVQDGASIADHTGVNFSFLLVISHLLVVFASGYQIQQDFPSQVEIAILLGIFVRTKATLKDLSHIGV